MPLIVADRVQETTNTTGTGAYTLGGAIAGFQTFAAAVSNTDTVYYSVTDDVNFEVGLGTYASSGGTITRTTVFASSNSDAAVNWGAGTKNIFLTYPADKAVIEDASNNVTIGNNLVVGGTVDGRDVAADGTKLDGVEASADVTDTANVTSAGAAMKANNLSDLPDKSTSRTNLGVAIGSNVQAYSSVLQNTTASFLTADETKLDYISVTQAVDLDQMETDIAALANGMVYKGDWDASSGSFPGGGSAQTGWFYYVSVAGTVNSIAFAVGDNIIATVDNASTSTYANNWSKHDQTDAVQAVVGLTGSIAKSSLLSALNVEDGADVTDTANVTSAGALMDSEVTNLAQVKAFDSADYATAAQGTLAASAVQPNDSPTFAGLTTTADVSFGDNDKLKFGDGSDLEIYHTGTTSWIRDVGGGDLQIFASDDVFIRGYDTNNYMARFNENGAVTLYHNNSAKFATSSTGVDVTGDLNFDGANPVVHSADLDGFLTVSGGGANTGANIRLVGGAHTTAANDIIVRADATVTLRYDHSATKFDFQANDILTTGTVTATGVSLGDNDKALFGDGSDLQIFHTGTSSWIRDLGTGGLVIDTNGTAIDIKGSSPTEYMARFLKDGAASLYYDGSEKLATTTAGVDVTGTVTATAFAGDGSALTGIAAGATGGGSDQVFYENGQNVTTNYTITNAKNAMSAGPITVDNGVTVTVGDGETWTVV